MNNRTTILLLSAVLIASVLSGCVQETSEIEAPDASPTEPASEVTSLSVSAPPHIKNWEYVSYRNLSISNAPALNQTARVTYSIIPDKDIEILFVYITIDGFEFVDVEGERSLTRGTMPRDDLERRAVWRPTNLSKGEMYQFNATIKAVKTGNFTIRACRLNEGMYISVSEDSAYISDEPFTKHSATVFGSNVPAIPVSGDMLENMTRAASEPSRYNLTPRPSNVSIIKPFDFWWDGTKWVYVQNRS